MSLNVKLQVFEGPLDLLLHLIEKNKVDIYDIPISMITEQYLEYIQMMREEDLNIASEFLVMAATLLSIKSKMLLPVEVNEEGEEEDPRAELVEKLIEYKMYKYMSFELKDMQIDACRTWFKGATLPDEIADYKEPIDYEKLVGDMDLSKLNHIFKSIMKRQVDKVDPVRSQFGKIEKDEVNLEEKTEYIENYIRFHKAFSFRDLLENQKSKMDVVVTFLIILEMIKIGKIMIAQEDLFDDIMITSKVA
ncbi:MAG: segregation/condensation protein A [Lachnospiraceae bacterium]|nr:segregation/condensation protein A [Lachnospiraceae bacterium]MCR4685266.1 segregation/condensation protein A [Lachnospiraceae bacterium]